MPTQDNEDVKKQPETEADEHKSEHLLPLFNASYDNYMDKLDDLQERKAEIQDKISRSEGKIAKLEEKAARLEATNAMLSELIDSGKLPKIAQKIIKANEDKIKSIDEKQIPKLESGIKRNKDKISKLDDRISITQLKAEKLKCFSNVLKSFMTPNPQKRREMFRKSMDGLRKSTKSLLNIDMNAERNKLAKLSEQYEKSGSMSEKFKLGQKIGTIKANISTLESKIHKLENAPKLHEASDHAVDKTIAKAEAQVENIDFMSVGEIFDFDKPIETVVLDFAEYLHNAEVSMEDDLSMIDGIINNGKKEQLDEMSNLSNGVLFTYEHEHSSGDQFWTDTAELLKKDDTFTYIKHDGWYGKDESVEVSVTEASALFHEAVEKSQSGNKDYTITAEPIQRQVADRPDVPLFLEEIDFSSCDDATLQAFRDSAKANMQCAKETSQALAKNYNHERYTLNSEQALADVREKFSDDRIAFVLANTLNGTSDGRIAKEVKDFAKNTLQNVPELYTKRNMSISSHAGLINLFAKTLMKSQAEREVEKPAPQQEQTKPEPKKAEKRVGFLSFEQFGETRFRVVDETANEILKLAANSEKPFVALMDVGRPVSEPEFAEIMQSTQAKFSVDINLDSDKVHIFAINEGKGGIAEGDRTDKNTKSQTVNLATFVKSEPTHEQKQEPKTKKARSEVRKINPDYYKKIPKEDRAITNEPAKVGAIIMSELEKQKVPFSAVETAKGVTITVSKENESAFRAAEDKAKDTHVRLINPEVFKQIPKEDRSIKIMPEKEANETIQKLEKDGISYSARLDGDKSAVTVRKSEAPAYFSRKQMKKLAQEVKGEKPQQTQSKSKGQEL